MNWIFWLLSVVMIILAITIICWPLLRSRQHETIVYRDSNLELYADKLAELDRDLAEQRIDQVAYRNARDELDRELLTDVPENSEDELISQGRDRNVSLAVTLCTAVFIPLITLVVYQQLGMHAESMAAQAEGAQQAQPEMTIDQMVEILETRLKTQGGDAEAWAMLGRAYKQQQRYTEAASAFEIALGEKPSSQYYLETAEAIALANGQKFDERSRDLILKALDLEPNNGNALWFAGVAEFQLGNHWSSVDHLAILAEASSYDETVFVSIEHFLRQSRKVLGEQGEDISPIDEVLQLVAEKAASMKPAGNGDVRRIMVSVDVSDDIRSRFEEQATVFVYARAQKGPPMPLAIQRIRLSDIPATIGLDDTMAMVEGMNLSAFEALELVARISPSGTAQPQTGDAIGVTSADDKNVTESTIMIDALVE